MSHALTVRQLAEADLTETYAWYEEQRTGLGREFLGEVEATFARIVEAPLRYPLVHREVRRVLTKRFPFAVFYIADAERVVIVAVLNQARDPERWRRRS
ncbi:MAG: type II toxin-antitoxin system RelE/ParE family toxin [Deltaproteobacteria bacterium]|nr:type II toxin-antitoxin system RelE/ParE family toxin [Deltaproteobacteria bacterium]